MRFGGVGDLIALAGFQNELAAVFKLRVQLALETKENMPLLTPMIGRNFLFLQRGEFPILALNSPSYP